MKDLNLIELTDLEKRYGKKEALTGINLTIGRGKIMDEVIFIKEGNIVTYKSADDLREESGKSIDALFREIFHTDVYRGGDEAC